MEEVVEYQKLLPYQFEERITACPLVYVPVGSLEWHGEHNALGLDAIKMHLHCVEAARLSGGIVFPPTFYGIPGMMPYGTSYEYPANLPMTAEFLKHVLTATLYGLENVGFKAAILITGHGCEGQLALMREIAKEYHGAMKVFGTNDGIVKNTSDHAAKWETSILWYARPELVDMSRLPKDTSIPLEGVEGKDPRLHASRELGKGAIEAVAKDLATKGEKLLAGLETAG